MELQASYLNDVYNSELYHHGILGQKWGVRRYQNSDGSLTDAGQARYSKRDQRKAKRAAIKAEKRADKLERQKNWKGPNTFMNRQRNKLADRGDDLRAMGKTIGTNNIATIGKASLIGLAGGVGTFYMAGKQVNLKWGKKNLASINSRTVLNGSRALMALTYAKGMMDNSAIRASYARDRDRRKRWKDKKTTG